MPPDHPSCLRGFSAPCGDDGTHLAPGLYAALSEGLPRDEAQRDLRLVEPAAMLRRVVDREPPPEPLRVLLAVGSLDRRAAVRVEVVEHEVDRAGVRIGERDLEELLREARRLPVPRHPWHVPPGLGLDGGEDVRRPAASVFEVPLGDPAAARRRGVPGLCEELDGLLVHAHHGFLRVERPLVEVQEVLHALDVLGVQLADAPHFFPAMA